jgi:hypothetical protein
MFKIEKSKTFKWPVKIHVPREGGTFATHEITAEFALQEQSKMDALLEAFKNDDTDMLPTVLIGWSGVQDPDGNVFEYSEENKAVLLDIPYVRTAVMKAYFAAATGNKQKSGN